MLVKKRIIVECMSSAIVFIVMNQETRHCLDVVFDSISAYFYSLVVETIVLFTTLIGVPAKRRLNSFIGKLVDSVIFFN